MITMKKMLLFAIVLVIILLSCDNNEQAITQLTINNQSSIEIRRLRWNNEHFPGSGTMAILVLPGTSTSKTVQAGTGFIFFEYNGSRGWRNARTNEIISIDTGEQRQIVFTNNTLVVDIQSNETGTLSGL